MAEDVPSPLQVGSPTQRRQSQYFSPPISDVSPIASPPMTQQPYRGPSPLNSATTSEEQLSKLFPSRRSSTGPGAAGERIPRPPSRQYSLPGTPSPALQPAYTIPQAPAPPSFAENTSYDRSADPFAVQHAPISSRPSRKQSVLNRLGSLKSKHIFRQAKYSSLEDQDGDLGTSRNKKLAAMEEEDEEYSAGSGPIGLRSMDPKKPGLLADEVDEQDLEQAGFVAEFERLEAADRALGLGMAGVIETPMNLDVPVVPVEEAPKRGKTIMHKRVPSNQNAEAQKQAEKTGEILAVPEPLAFDLSNLGGGDFGMNDPLKANAEEKTNHSYYFPEDPDMPNWRPKSLHWIYITTLILIALVLAGIQEYVCQLSIKRAKNNSGLLKFQEAAELSMTEYFTWKYAPTIILLTYGILWQITDYEVKRLEPYYQLSRRTGATAAESLNLDYISLISLFVPLQAIRHRHWAVVLSSFSFLVAGSVVPTLQSASVSLYPEKQLRKPDEDKFVRIDVPWSRAVTAMLVFTAAMGTTLLFLTRRKSGLLSDPKGVAGVAAMATRSHILNDFRGLDTAPQNVINKQLRNRRYILHKSSLWQGEYIRNSPETSKVHNTDSRPALLTKRAAVPFIISIFVVGILIPVLLFTPANIVTEKVPWLLTAIAAAIKLVWGSLDMSMRLMEPWYILSLRGAPAQTLTLDYTGTIPGYISIKAFFNKHYLVSIVGFGAILTEVLTVCASSFGVDGQKFISGNGRGDLFGGDEDGDEGNDRSNSGETFKSFWVSFALSGLILLYLIVVASVAVVRRSRKILPRTPGSVSSTLAFIHQSKMLTGFVGTEKLDSVKMTHWLIKQGKTYGFGWYSGRDQQDYCGIDEEPLAASYVWGKDWTKSRLTGAVDDWQHF